MKRLKARISGFYKYRFLLKQLVLKDVKLKYRRSFLGYLWSVLNPLLLMSIMIIVFSTMFTSDVDNYPVYLITGQTLFTFFNEGTTQAIFSITGNGALLKKTYVPKYIFTVSKVTSSIVNLIFSMGAMFLVFIICRVNFNWYFLFLPLVLFQLYLFTLGLGLFLAQAAVFFRDIQYIYSVFITAWMYLTPLFYPLKALPEYLQSYVIHLNPLYCYVSQFRSIVLEGIMPQGMMILRGCIVSVFFLIFGTWIFFKSQDKFILYI